MSFEDLKSLGPNVSITMTTTDWLEIINYIITATRREMEQVIKEDKDEVYLSRKEAAELIGVSVSCLYRWKKKEYALTPIYVGGSVRYSKTDVEKLLGK